jgi:hypothetical protein
VEIRTQCIGCKKTTDLRTCFHCEKPLCADCRGKHHESQKKEVDQSVRTLETQTDQLIVLARMYPSVLDISDTRLALPRGTEY